MCLCVIYQMLNYVIVISKFPAIDFKCSCGRYYTRRSIMEEHQERRLDTQRSKDKDDPFYVHKSKTFINDGKYWDGIYKTCRKPRGLLLMFTCINFKNDIKEKRYGAEVDATKLNRLFTEIGFEVCPFTDFSEKEIRDVLENHSALSMKPETLFVVVSSHGEESFGSNDICCSDGKTISVETIISFFNNDKRKDLADVPKVFIFQLCRGQMKDYVEYDGCSKGKSMRNITQTKKTLNQILKGDNGREPLAMSSRKLKNSTDCGSQLLRDLQYNTSTDCASELPRDIQFKTSTDCASQLPRDIQFKTSTDCASQQPRDIQFKTSTDCASQLPRDIQFKTSTDCASELPRDIQFKTSTDCASQLPHDIQFKTSTDCASQLPRDLQFKTSMNIGLPLARDHQSRTKKQLFYNNLPKPKKMPLYTNMLVVQSTLPGFVSRRDPRGSWYMQALCAVFAEQAWNTDVESLFRKVDEALQQEFKIQTSSRDSRGFNKLLYLHPGLFSSEQAD